MKVDGKKGLNWLKQAAANGSEYAAKHIERLEIDTAAQEE